MRTRRKAGISRKYLKTLTVTEYRPSANAVSCQGNVPKIVTFDFVNKEPRGITVMKKTSEKGFSLIELVIVCAIIGLVASMAIPFLQKAIRAAENGNTFATMRTISSTQVSYFQQNSRFARITEVNNLMSNSIGTNSGNTVTRGKFVMSMFPATPTDAQLRDGYTIDALRNVSGEFQVYQYRLTEKGEIVQVQP